MRSTKCWPVQHKRLDMRIVFNDFLPFKGFSAVTIGEWVFVRKSTRVTTTLIQHESIHVRQWRECLYVLFPLIYRLSYLWQLARRRNFNEAYRNVCFEREAYAHQKEEGYLNNRKLFAWLR